MYSKGMEYGGREEALSLGIGIGIRTANWNCQLVNGKPDRLENILVYILSTL